jgi:hypothetical protein
MVTFVAAAMLLVQSLADARPQTDRRMPRGVGSSAPEMMQIDGGRNPELIPQWSAWGYLFRLLSGGPRQLPSAVLQLVSKEEESMVLKEADVVQKIDAGCQARIARAGARLGVEKPASVDGKVREISLECRRATLHARDNILDALNPAAAAALMDFVESTKVGTSLTIPKKQLSRFLEPE